jgi:hypothetical protein
VNEIIHVVEPTLSNEAGHCYSFVAALCKASDATRTLRLWASRHATLSFAGRHIEVQRHFYRKIRRFQAYFLFRRLLKAPGRVFVSTARYTDLALLDLAAGATLPPKKAYAYVHWFNPSASKQASLRKLARKQPNIEIYGPTPTVIKVFEDAGFRHARVVPYPISRVEAPARAAQPFRHLLYAGAARSDKGFSHVVDLVALLHAQGENIPVVLQTSSEGKVDGATRADLDRLAAIAYPHLKICPDTLDAQQYAELFTGAICLQLYDAAAFADRISGVTLDAFSAGAPVITTAGSWIARMAERFGAGSVVAGTAPAQVLAAVKQQMAGYDSFQASAREAGDVLQQENSADTLYRLLATQNEQ